MGKRKKDWLDPEWFREKYLDPNISILAMANAMGVTRCTVSTTARKLGLPSRNELGIHCEESAPLETVEKPPGLTGCNETCPAWERCKGGRGWLDILPCEVYIFPDEDPDLIELRPGLNLRPDPAAGYGVQG